jgi:hypothetical protein
MDGDTPIEDWKALATKSISNAAESEDNKSIQKNNRKNKW